VNPDSNLDPDSDTRLARSSALELMSTLVFVFFSESRSISCPLQQ
jgi:hypothetical protein